MNPERLDGDDGVCMMRGCCESDFLPTTCHECRRRYCSKHLRPSDHNCAAHTRSEAKTVACPLCQQSIAVRPGETPDFAVSRHIDTGCAPQAAQQAAAIRLNMCSVHSCTRNEVQKIVCEYCRQTFCVEHRSAKAHSCTAKPVTPPRSPPPSASPRSSTDASPPPAGAAKKPKRPAYVPLAQQQPRNTPATALQLPPSTATGRVDGHVIVAVHGFLPLKEGGKPRSIAPAYFSLPPSAPLGRVLDGVCRALDVPNNNHLAPSDADKLWLHALPPPSAAAGSSGVCLPPSLTVRDCVESFGAGYDGTASPPRVIVTLGNELPPQVVADLAGDGSQSASSSPAQPSAEGRVAAAAAAPRTGGAAGAAKRPAGGAKKKDDGCVAA